MDHSELKRSRVEISTDWEEALHLYENVIACESKALQVRAIIKLARLADHAPDDILARTIPILVELLGSPIGNSSPSIQEAAAYCLKCIACQGEGTLAVIIGQSGAIPYLLRLLPHSDGSLQRVLLKCLRNIVTFGDLNRMIVVRNGGLEIILNMCNSCPDGSRRFLLEILSALALLREVRRVIVSLGGLRFVVESARCGSMISRTRAAQVIGLLGLVRRARRMLVDSGAISALIDLLRDGDISTKLVAGNALGVISSHVDYIRPVAQAGAIPLYAELLQGPDPMGKEIAEDVFCILAVAEANAVTIAEHLVRILRGDNDEAKAAAADVLWDLSGYKHSLSVVRNSGAIPILVELLRNGNGDVREKVSGAVAQLSYNEADRVALADAGAIPILIDMLQDESDELRDNAAEALVNFSEDPLLCDRISDAFSIPSFQNMQDRLIQIRASNARLAVFDTDEH
uniref:Putative armadillo repeat-containing protein 4 n=1 Tax=Davidia involucrata TaxID=16924 RepID=A0A5B7BPT4_DAVIN